LSLNLNLSAIGALEMERGKTHSRNVMPGLDPGIPAKTEER